MIGPNEQATTGCSCCGDLPGGRLDRRRFLYLAGMTGAAAALRPFGAHAAGGNYEAMVLSCMDPRFQEPVRLHLARRMLTGKYSHFAFAGAAIGVVAPAFKDWHKTFWDNLAASIELHNIKTIIAINHRDCGAAKIAYGADKVARKSIETQTHRQALALFRKEVGARQPKLAVETGLMALNGRVETFRD